MFVIRRKIGESIIIDGGIEIQVLDVSANRVRLGVTAPDQTAVLRKEVLLAREQNRAAADSPLSPDLHWLASAMRSKAVPSPAAEPQGKRYTG